METYISSYCKINTKGVWSNGKQIVATESGDDINAILAKTYKQFELNYPKFHKMDRLCKLATLASEQVIQQIKDFSRIPKNEIALVFSNHSSSIESDRKHITSIEDRSNYFPSPAVFVYTLSNILIGEIAIKHGLTGENAFFISENFDADLIQNYSENLLASNTTNMVIGGWVNADESRCEAFVYCVKKGIFKQENEAFSMEHTGENVLQLYK